jgi:magnesium transporter
MPPTHDPHSQDQASQDRLLHALEHAPATELDRLVAGLHPALLADLLESMAPERRLEVWSRAGPRARGEILTELHDEVLRGLAEAADPEALAQAMAPLQPDELADLESDVPAEAFGLTLELLDPGKRHRFARVRHYPDDVAGGLMDVDAVTVGPEVTLAAAVQHLRELTRDGAAPPEHMDSFFVVADDDRLLGVLPLVTAVTGRPQSRVRAALVPSAGIPVAAPVTDVVRTFQDEDLLSAPVVDDEGVLLGRITVDDVVDVISQQTERSIMVPAGLDEDQDLFAPLRKTLRQRGLWLGVNLVNAFLAAWVIQRFEHAIEQLVALAVLMPVVASMGGVAGQQSLALAIRGLALNQVGRTNRWRLLRHEVIIGLAVGVAFAVLVAAVAFLWYRDPQLALVIALALVGNMVIGTSMGTLYPITLKRLNVDPALAGGTALTATTDVLGFLALLGLASLMLL